MAELLEEVREIVGVVPEILRHMHEAGELERHWPGIRRMFEEPEIPKPVVLLGILAALTLRCGEPYCFVMYSSSLRMSDARIDPRELARWYEFPEHVPDHARWSRLLKLLALLDVDGPHQRAAEHALRASTSPAEFESLRHVAATARVVMGYSSAKGIAVEDEHNLAAMPEEVRALIPEFVRFHTEFNDRSRPVAALCSGCRKARAANDERWYPFEAARELLPEDVLFSHGLCASCERELLAS